MRLLLLFVLILGFGSTFELFYTTFVELLTLFVLAINLVRYKIGFNPRHLYIIVIIWFFVILSAIFTGSSIVEYNSLTIRPFFVLLMLSLYNKDKFIFKMEFYKVLKLVAWLALVNIILITFMPSLFSIKTHLGGYTVNTIGYVFNYIVKTERFGITFARNQGLFWEPGVLQILMNIMIFIGLFELKKKVKDLWLPIIVLITTASTSGYILFAIQLLFWYKEFMKDSKHIILALIYGVLVIGSFYPLLKSELEYKTTTGIGSTNKRTYDTLTGITVALNNPIWGIGPSKDKYMEEIKSISVVFGDEILSYNRPNSNAFVSLFYKYGFLFALIYLYFLYNQSIFKNKLLFFLIIVVGLNSEPIAVVYLQIIFLLSSLYFKKVNNI